jgi:hypothetical protein
VEIFNKIFGAGASLLVMFEIQERFQSHNLRYLADEFEMDKQFSNQKRPKKCILNFVDKCSKQG